MKVILSPRAELDFEAQVKWLRQHSPDTGRRAADSIVRTLDLLTDFPEIGPAVSRGLREKHVEFGRDGFVIRYRVHQDHVRIMRILHGRQDR